MTLFARPTITFETTVLSIMLIWTARNTVIYITSRRTGGAYSVDEEEVCATFTRMQIMLMRRKFVLHLPRSLTQSSPLMVFASGFKVIINKIKYMFLHLQYLIHFNHGNTSIACPFLSPNHNLNYMSSW